VLRAKHLTLDTQTQEGVVTEGTLTLGREGYRIWGKRLLKTGPMSYTIEDGGFTACDGTWPSWRVEASRVRLDRVLTTRGASFWVESVPVAYTPYLLFPVVMERQSGFLIPKLAFSDRSGATVIVPYYWAFSESADAVLRLEYRSRRGLTEGVELRYALAEGHEGTAEVTHLHDRVDDAERYRVKADHRSAFSDVTHARLHVDYLGDKRFFRDFGDTIQDRGVERLESYFLATHDLDAGALFAFVDYIEALQQSQAETLQVLPSLGLVGREMPVGAGFNLDPSVRFTRFDRKEGLRGERLELHPVVSRGWSAGGIGLAARVGYREHLYRVDGRTIRRGAADASLTASALLARTFGNVVHSVEPKLIFFGEEEGRGGDIPVFDAADSFGRRVELGLLLENRLLRAADLAPLAGLDLQRSLGLAAGEPQDWRLSATLTPSDRLGLRATADYQPSLADPWRAWSATGLVADTRGDKVEAGYHYVQGRVSYAAARFTYAVTRDLAATYRHHYSSRDRRTLEQALGFQLTHSCWELVLSYSRNNAEADRYEQRYFASLQLKGLGKVGTVRGILP
ncbi:MAG: LPS-assembly protein LptD, partial [Deltaproteobacteria bacterium]|nr:LPS-assembly protein LptD [Deltaproteobacteria bacterium]